MNLKFPAYFVFIVLLVALGCNRGPIMDGTTYTAGSEDSSVTYSHYASPVKGAGVLTYQRKKGALNYQTIFTNQNNKSVTLKVVRQVAKEYTVGVVKLAPSASVSYNGTHFGAYIYDNGDLIGFVNCRQR